MCGVVWCGVVQKSVCTMRPVVESPVMRGEERVLQGRRTVGKIACPSQVLH